MRFELFLVFVFDNAAGLNIGKVEGFYKILLSAALFDGFFKNFAVEIDDGAVWVNCASTDVPNVTGILKKRNLDAALICSFFGENLDSDVFSNRSAVGVYVLFAYGTIAVEDHGVRAGTGGIVLEGEVRGRDGKPIIGLGRPRRGDRTKQKEKKGRSANESLGSIHVEGPLHGHREKVPRE